MTIQVTWRSCFSMLFPTRCKSSCYGVIFLDHLASSQIKFYSLREHHFHGSQFFANHALYGRDIKNHTKVYRTSRNLILINYPILGTFLGVFLNLF